MLKHLTDLKTSAFLNCGREKKTKIVNFQRQEKSKTKKRILQKSIIIIDFSEIL